MFKYLYLFVAMYTGYQVYAFNFNDLILPKSTISLWGFIVFLDFAGGFIKSCLRESAKRYVNKKLEEVEKEIKSSPNLTKEEKNEMRAKVIFKELFKQIKPKEK